MKKVIITLLSMAWVFQLSMAQGNNNNDNTQRIYAIQKVQNMLLDNNIINGAANDYNGQWVYSYQQGQNNLIQDNNEIEGSNNDWNSQILYSWIKGDNND
ncbi:hypothetical protein, partial [Xanthovirga aplysinae]|uniref:hypothetical protein n=1 Tax=Xanthovirga aplysinae TaxID=2529853 RepID=UPI0012BCF707